MKLDLEKLEFGMGVYYWLGDNLFSKPEDDLTKINDKVNVFKGVEVDKNGNYKIGEMPMTLGRVEQISYVLRAAIVTGGGKDIGDKEAKEWCLANWISAIKVYINFLKTQPGSGDNDQELKNMVAAKSVEAA
jgi:hypothetical protein